MTTKWEVNRAVRASALPPPSRLVMLVLSDIAEAGTAEVPAQRTPSLAVLAKETGLNEATVKRHLNALDDAGWLKRTKPTVDAARRLGERTRYQLLVPIGQGAESAQGPEDQGAEEAQTRAQTSPRAGRTVRPIDKEDDQNDLNDQSSPAPGAPPDDKPSAKSKRGTRIPDDFRATDDMIAWARAETPLVGAKETDAFVDYWRSKPGQNATKLDWVLTWKNWMRRAQVDAAERAHRAQARASPRTSTDPAPYHRQWTPED